MKWQPTPAFLPGEFHGQRSLAGYSPWTSKELDTTERLTPYKGKCDYQWLQRCPEILSLWSCAEAADFINCLFWESYIITQLPWTICFQNSLENDSLRSPIAVIFPFFCHLRRGEEAFKIAFLQFHHYHSGHETGYSHSQWYGKTGFLWYLFYNLKPSSFCHLGADDWWRKISCAISWSDWEYWVLLQYWTVSAVKCRKWALVMYFSVI